MKLSDAMRLGAMLRPQAIGGLYAIRPAEVVGDVLGLRPDVRVASCAMGAAYEAAGCRPQPAISDGTRVPFRGGPAVAGEEIETIKGPDEWGAVLYRTVSCPLCAQHGYVFLVIAHLNDGHQQTREQIADWVERIENSKQEETHIACGQTEEIEKGA